MIKYICPLLFLLLISKVGFSQQNTTPEFVTSEEIVRDEKITKAPSFGDAGDIITQLDEEKTKQYDAHWAGMDIGTLILMNENFNTSFDANPYWKNNIAKSVSLNLNFYEYKVPFVKQYFGMTTGLGFSISTIGFKDNYLLQHNKDSTYAIKDTVQSYKTNSLSSIYLTVPLLLEFSSKAKQKKSTYVTAGLVGGLRIVTSTTKTGKYSNGDRFQNVVHSNYNLTPFTLDAMFRAGFDGFGVYASYQLNSLFMKDKTVNIYPLKVGVTFNMNFYKKEKNKEDEIFN